MAVPLSEIKEIKIAAPGIFPLYPSFIVADDDAWSCSVGGVFKVQYEGFHRWGGRSMPVLMKEGRVVMSWMCQTVDFGGIEDGVNRACMKVVDTMFAPTGRGGIKPNCGYYQLNLSFALYTCFRPDWTD